MTYPKEETGFPWPEGKQAALAITFDLDAESLMSHQRYGPVAGVHGCWRSSPSG